MRFSGIYEILEKPVIIHGLFYCSFKSAQRYLNDFGHLGQTALDL